jgi:protein Tex
MNIVQQLITELQLKEFQVVNTIELIDSGNTIPFIARYRKEKTGELSDIQLRKLADRLIYLRNLESRKEEVFRLIGEQDKLTFEIEEKIKKSKTLQEIEDIYRPFKPKRRTRATIAKEKGLEPLADLIIAQNIFTGTLEDLAASFVNPEKEVFTVEEALEGAKDIIAEIISDDADYRKKIRDFTLKEGALVSSATEKEKTSVYEMYYTYSEKVKTIPAHRILAMNRGEKENILKVKIDLPWERVLEDLKKQILKPKPCIAGNFMEDALEDAYKRLIWPSVEREIRGMLTERGEEKALKYLVIT